MHVHGNLSAMYEYCNIYVIFVILEALFKPDFGFIAEYCTRWFILLLLDSN